MRNEVYICGYRPLSERTGKLYSSNKFNIKKKECKLGFCISTFEFSSSYFHLMTHQDIKKLALKVSVLLSTRVTVSLYFEFSNQLKVYKNQKISKIK